MKFFLHVNLHQKLVRSILNFCRRSILMRKSAIRTLVLTKLFGDHFDLLIGYLGVNQGFERNTLDYSCCKNDFDILRGQYKGICVRRRVRRVLSKFIGFHCISSCRFGKRLPLRAPHESYLRHEADKNIWRHPRDEIRTSPVNPALRYWRRGTPFSLRESSAIKSGFSDVYVELTSSWKTIDIGLLGGVHPHCDTSIF